MLFAWNLKVYRSGSAARCPGGGTWRRRGTDQPVHGTNGGGAGGARHHRRDVRLPLHDGRPQRPRSARRARAHAGARRSTRRASRVPATLPLFIGGKSMGGRIASQVASQGVSGVRGLVFLGYPLHPPGKPEQRRDAHLPAIREPMLFVQGTRDAFGTADEIRALLPRLQQRDAVTRSPAATTRSRSAGAARRSRTRSWRASSIGSRMDRDRRVPVPSRPRPGVPSPERPDPH